MRPRGPGNEDGLTQAIMGSKVNGRMPGVNTLPLTELILLL